MLSRCTSLLALACIAVSAHAASPSASMTRAEAQAVDELEIALDRWIEATNQRDFETQARFYPARMEAFYLKRQVSKDAVLAEKRRVFQRARHIEIDAEDPQIIVEPDVQRARMYFRKVYDIRTDTRQREGEVLQELRWLRTDHGWQIVSERDLYVID